MKNFDDKRWNKQYEQLVEFKRKNGHCIVKTSGWKDTDNKSLGMWVNNQRTRHTNNEMRQDRQERLEKIGFAWKTPSVKWIKQWDKQYKQLVEFKRNNGHCLVPQGYKDEDNNALGMWVSNQRREKHTNNEMRQARKELLDKIGFAWENPNVKKDKRSLWEKHHEQRVDFNRQRGHCIVTTCKDEDDKARRNWESNQRHFHVSNKLRLDRKVLLDELELASKVRAAQYERLVEIKRTNMWNMQYEQLVISKLRLDRKVLLNELELASKVRAAQYEQLVELKRINMWNTQYEQLVEFKQTNGHCLVPRRYQEDMALGMWVNTQRGRHANNTMRQDRKDEIGFACKTNQTWHQQYEKLVEFKQTNGHCLVPRGYKKDMALGTWVGNQRGRHTNNEMRQDRKELLDELGFAWKVRATGADNKKHDKYWHQQYGKLLEFKQTNGNTLAARSSTTDVSCP
jgi:hypothetical protein